MIGYEFGDIVYLEVVLYAREEVSCPRWFPPVVVPLLESGAVGLFFFRGEGKDGFGEGELGVDVGGAEAVVFDVEEACYTQLAIWLRCFAGGREGRVVPISSIAFRNWVASSCFPSGWSNLERSRVARSAQSRFSEVSGIWI
jgi:hypothetical protein